MAEGIAVLNQSDPTGLLNVSLGGCAGYGIVLCLSVSYDEHDGVVITPAGGAGIGGEVELSFATGSAVGPELEVGGCTGVVGFKWSALTDVGFGPCAGLAAYLTVGYGFKTGLFD